MLVASIADVHLGNHRRFGGPIEVGMNERCRLSVAVFKRACERAVHLGCQVLIVVGDLLDYDRPEPQLIAAVQDVCAKTDSAGCRVVLVLGNHEQTSADPGDHALDPFGYFATIIDKPTRLTDKDWDAEILCLPFRPGKAEDWFEEAVRSMLPSSGGDGSPPAKVAGRPRALAVHLGIRDKKTAPWLVNAADSIDVSLVRRVASENDITQVLAGNWHDRRRWKFAEVDVFQLGALVPTGWDNPGIDGYGTLAIWDSSDGVLSYEEIPGPRFIKLPNGEGLKEFLASAGDNKLYVSTAVLPENMASVTGYLEGLKKQGAVAHIEVLPDKSFAASEARTAAKRAASAENIDQALERFVKAMPVDDTVDRGRVLARCKEYLRA